ncbi:ABC transporter ATP-binding protein [Paenibacillus psychroresistens]|uniref:ABC transporter ATP-binding protein n=1 Tax=Paenibacillus psychroresistens TaxID=1778678 RepID=A0A6B8REW1_9BACL|nr:ABC transporter ATP-binding protein [Paenibacillus psychroresistens]QGQ94012.1 ABC transporter ATP-binding protein [Paenibacillus psychroresistens]
MLAQERENRLELIDLQAGFIKNGQYYAAIDQISFQIKPGQVTCVVGESGSGKSVLALSIMNLLPQENGKRTKGEIWLNGQNLAELKDIEMNALRGKEIAMVFQEPMTALNPILTIGFQIEEAMLNHLSISKQEAHKRAVDLLKQVGITRAESMIHEYPHKLSGGMRQRVIIAMAIACEPKLLIADEPTTALDVSVQAQILELFKAIQRKHAMAILLITHDLGVVAEIADNVVVMYAGQIVEQGDVDVIFHDPKHPYLKLLLQLIPQLDQERERFEAIQGSIPALMNRPLQGCRFAERCPVVMEKCYIENPLLADSGANHYVRCLQYPDSDPANLRNG